MAAFFIFFQTLQDILAISPYLAVRLSAFQSSLGCRIYTGWSENAAKQDMRQSAKAFLMQTLHM
jgi:hypothetical protein